MSSMTTEFKTHMVEIVRNMMEYREKNNVSRNDFIQLLMELRKTGKIMGDTANESEKCDNTTNTDSGTATKEFMTIEQCAAQVALFYLAGFDTTASAIANCIFELSRMPDLMQRLQREIDDVLGKYDNVISYESINAMNFLDCCVSGKQMMTKTHPKNEKKSLDLCSVHFRNSTQISNIAGMVHFKIVPSNLKPSCSHKNFGSFDFNW